MTEETLNAIASCWDLKKGFIDGTPFLYGFEDKDEADYFANAEKLNGNEFTITKLHNNIIAISNNQTTTL